MSVNIKYKNNSIATLTDTGTKTLKTSGKYCEADIIVENTKDGGGGGTNYGTVTYETYSRTLSFGVPIPEDNFFVAILPTGTINSFGGSYLYHLNYRKINGKEFCITQGSDPSAANSLPPTFDRSANTMTLNSHYFKDSYEYMWYMGALQ